LNYVSIQIELGLKIFVVEGKPHEVVEVIPCYDSQLLSVVGDTTKHWEVFELLQVLDSKLIEVDSKAELNGSDEELHLKLNRVVVLLHFEYYGEANVELVRLQEKLCEILSVERNFKRKLCFNEVPTSCCSGIVLY